MKFANSLCVTFSCFWQWTGQLLSLANNAPLGAMTMYVTVKHCDTVLFPAPAVVPSLSRSVGHPSPGTDRFISPGPAVVCV